MEGVEETSRRIVRDNEGRITHVAGRNARSCQNPTMADFHLWATIRQPVGLYTYIVTISAVPWPICGEDIRVEQFSADTMLEAESVRGKKLMEWGNEIRERGDCVVDVIDD